VVDELSLDKRRKLGDRLGLPRVAKHETKPMLVSEMRNSAPTGEASSDAPTTYVLKHTLHDADRNLGRLDKPVLAVLNVEPRLLLLGALSRRLECLASRVELEPGLGDGLSGTDGVLERLGERPLEGLEKALVDLKAEREADMVSSTLSYSKVQGVGD